MKENKNMSKSYSDFKYQIFSTLTEADEHGARELHLYADNHADLHRQRTTPVHKNLRNKMAAGKYDHEKAKKAFKHVADDAAKRYKSEHGHHFDVATRKHVAGKMADQFHDEAKSGDHDHHLHKKHKGHKVGEAFDSANTVELEEKNVPTDPTKWAASKAAAKSKFDVYPSAYANAWAAKNYKSKGGSWKTAKESVEQVDELKKDTLLKYKEKAKQDKNDIARLNQRNRGPLVGRDRRDFGNRSKGIDGATKRLISKQYDEEVDENYEARNVMKKIGVQGMITPEGQIKVPMRDRKRLDTELKKNNIKNYKISNEDFKLDELDAKTLIRYNNAASQQVARDTKTDTGKVTPKTTKRLKGALKARKKLDKIMPGLRQEDVEEAYDSVAVGKEIKKDPRIKGKEAKAIHGLLKGRKKSVKNTDAEAFVKKHDCATHVEHAEWGQGTPVKTMHAEPDENGNIDWYDVMFEHGIEKGVPTNDMRILMSEAHHH